VCYIIPITRDLRRLIKTILPGIMPDLLSIIPLCHYLMPYRIIWLCFLPNTLSLIAKPVWFFTLPKLVGYTNE